MPTPSVSVVMPARNAATTVADAIESLRRQDLDDFEVILVDHLSTDGTLEIMRWIAQTDARIRVLQCRGSFVEAANLAWRESSGDLIARMDSDDFALPSRLRKQRDLLLSHPELAGCATQVRILKRSEPLQLSPPDGGYSRYERWINSVIEPGDIASQRFIDSPLPNPATMVKRSVLESFGGYSDPPWAEDYDLWLRVLDKGLRLGKVPEVLLHWHDGPKRATRTIERYSRERFQEAKAFYLARLETVRSLGVVICGAGPTGKEMAGLLRNLKIPVHAFIEVNTRQIGNRIASIPVLGTDQVAKFPGRAVMLSAVGRGSGRDQVRMILTAAGFNEGESFFCVA